MKTKLLIVVDMQNDFVTGALANPLAKAIIPNIVKKLEQKDYNYLLFTRDTHSEDYLETEEGKNLPITHCLFGTEGWQIVPELEPFMDGAQVINKTTFGHPFWPNDLSRLYDNEKDEPVEIELCGTVTSICVAANAILLKAFFPKIKISVDASCCADLNEETHIAALKVLKAQQINVTNE